MKGLRARITPARWRKIHFRILGIGVCLILLNLGMGGSFLDGIPILAAMVLVILDFIGAILFSAVPPAAASSGSSGAATATAADTIST